MLEVRNLVKKYGDKTAINGLDFHVQAGEIVGLLGLNGAGKSTTMNCMTGYIAPTQGTVIVDGHDIRKEPDKAKSMIGYLPEVFSFYPDMKVKEYLNFVCDLKMFPKDKQLRKEHIMQICARVGIADLTGRMIRNLSKGYKQRVGFAQALIGNPGVLILDEPTVGLDPSQIIEIRQLIKDSGRESTVIVSSHILSEIQAICSRILVIHDGHIVADGSPSQLMEGTGRQELRIRIRHAAEDEEAGVPTESVRKAPAEAPVLAPAEDLAEEAADQMPTAAEFAQIKRDYAQMQQTLAELQEQMAALQKRLADMQ